MTGPDLYRAIGGVSGCRKLSTAFYARVKQDPLLRPLFPGKTMTCAIEEFMAFLAQFLGGPAEDAHRRWWVSLRESHLRFKIGPGERTAWMGHMVKALDDVEIEEPLRTALREFFARSSAYVVNTGSASAAAPRDAAIDRELAHRWDAQRALDEAVAAVRSGDAERAIALARGPALQECFGRSRSMLVGLLGVMVGSRNDAMLSFVQQRLAADPALAHERYAGRTLLHVASAQGSLPLVKLLLTAGADPNVTDAASHTPLYSVANECSTPGGGHVVRCLVEHGADVNGADGVKRCTPLHMAARRGNVEIADALLQCGADLEARDSLGETPLRRAVNCDKPDVAALFLKWGANVHSLGSKNLTPVLAARSRAMKQLLA